MDGHCDECGEYRPEDLDENQLCPQCAWEWPEPYAGSTQAAEDYER